ncbi:phage head-tail joining protein [Ancylobacter sp. SL191]|uniref:phage head-tail joining protein n=1 Tax=Ancylobacter sp. SL191 TaxID=2995166 RepID=UPI003B63655E
MTDLLALTEQLRELREARASGVRRAEFRDRTVEYRSDGELAAAIRDLETRIAAAEGRPAVSVIRPRSLRNWT